MKLYFNIGFGICAKYYMLTGFPHIIFRRMMVAHMQRFLRTTHSHYIDHREKYKIYKFKKLGDQYDRTTISTKNTQDNERQCYEV